MTNEVLAASLRRRWPDAVITPSEDPADFHALEWRVQSGAREVEGALSRDGCALILEGHIEDVADIAIWFRSLVPAVQPLLFYDEGYSADVPLSAETTTGDLIKPFLPGS